MDEGGEGGMSRKAQAGSLITDFWMRGVSPGRQNEPRHKLGEWQPIRKGAVGPRALERGRAGH